MYNAYSKRYENMIYNRCGRSGLKLPAISLGLWHNFGNVDKFDNCRKMIYRAFDLGITHFDLANNYGPPAGSAETTFGRILSEDLKPYRDEIIISTKAGYFMWDGPYGDWGSKKYLVASLDQSLKRMGLDYVDIFYHHRPDPETPIEETMRALDLIVRQGKALYIGLSNYGPLEAKRAFKILRDLGTPCLIHQPKYSMLDRTIENGLLDTLEQEKVGAIVFSPLAGGLLSNRYLKGIPEDSRASRPDSPFLNSSDITSELLDKLMKLHVIANARDQKLSQMALSWILRKSIITSVLIGASRISQIEECVEAVHNTEFTEEELSNISEILGG
ncbi:L-glyceraldehyde 3-phosphate reductase [Candidatus Epulonipiscium fishelsonii]|uniref:L-glyceraldehyde 3-phosphate reductase n=1 Tax=Candidatus Epulonipiscium fishelsonii TaxID=77094 RepID=A0ACC8XCD2_9FIRM|nr:L-glyceraldehyde 3-phosphate reductase [Epulopiscium sp. SCG-B11WGA-EpuloA1]ONI41373.1 L-glyceraldehyde 3-phosphate reductase [Epulopiscium sp. SCG-B05WGA-EpuloA1]